MKIMHLSDLHLGKSILEQSLIEDQEYILNQIIEIVIQNEINLVLIVGDVYDKGIPNVDAVNLFSNFLTRLYKLNIKVLVISGNHDSKDRLSFGNELFIDNDVYIEGIFKGELEKRSFYDSFGELNFYMLPFVKPADVRKYYPDIQIDSYDDAVRAIINNTVIDKNKRNIIMIHQFVTASGVDIERADSENLSLGGLDNIDVLLFDDFDYVALGHIHKPQKLIKETVRYSGSPLKYSFSEVNYNKSVPIIELRNKGDINIDLIKLKPIRDMRIIKGNFDEVLSGKIDDRNKDDYISVVLTDNDYIMDAIGKLRCVYKNILRLEYDNKRTSGYVLNDSKDNIDVKVLSEIELFSKFYELQNNIELSVEKRDIVERIIEEIKDK